MCQALQSRSLVSDTRAEKQLVTLLSIPLDTYDVVQVLQLVNYPHVMSLLTTATRKVSSIHMTLLLNALKRISPLFIASTVRPASASKCFVSKSFVRAVESPRTLVSSSLVGE